VIVHPEAAAGTHPARLTGREPMGADTLLWLDLHGHRLSARVPPEIGPELHDTVHIAFDPAGVSLFDPASGLRL
jgi:ABC-type sugar transport system ATPase subunit